MENSPALKSHLPAGEAKQSQEPLSQRVRALRLPTAAAAAESKTAWLAWTLCAVLAASTGCLGYLYLVVARQPSEASAVSETKAAEAPPRESAAAPVAPAGGIVLESKGYIIPAHQILISPKVAGMITKLGGPNKDCLQEGQRFAKGEILAELEDIDYLADYRRAEATLALAQQHLAELENGSREEEIRQAQAELKEAETQLEQLERDYGRSHKLTEMDAISKDDYEQIKSRRDAMLKRVDRLRNAFLLVEKGPRDERKAAARAEVDQAKAELAKAKWRWENCIIRAPLSGTILKKNAEEGNIVNPIAFNGSFSLCEMANLAELEVDLAIQERDVARVFQGQKCRIRAEAFPDRLYHGYVSRLMPIADRAKGAIPVRVKIDIPPEEEGVYLKPEMGALVSFLSEKAEK